MNAELLSAFDALASHCDVSAALCEAAGQGELDMPLDLHAICTRIGLPQARAGDLERSLISGKAYGLFVQSTPLTWQVSDSTLALKLAPFLHGARLYRLWASKQTPGRISNPTPRVVASEVLVTSDSQPCKASDNPDVLGSSPSLSRWTSPRSTADAIEIRRRTVEKVREDLSALVTEQPHTLMELHADIERVSLQQMIDKYRGMLDEHLTENTWQKFFDQNIFILTMLLCGPVSLVSSQFHAQPSGIKGTGAQIGDYLFRGAGQVLAIVEIKKPSTPLVQKTEYRRGGGVHAPDSELSGAVSQVLYQRHSLQTAWGAHRDAEELAGTRPDNTRCVIIAGTLPAEPKILRAFETFRCSHKDVEIITFDELLRKLEILLVHLTAD